MRRGLKIDWYIVGALIPILVMGLVTMNSFGSATGSSFFGTLFGKQLIWIVVAFVVFFTVSHIDFRFLRRAPVIITLYAISLLFVGSLFILGHVSHGAANWLRLGLFSVQPSDPMKLVLILLLAKYFTRRHVEIAHIRHIIVSGVYAAIPFAVVALTPDFGSAITIFFIWLGMVLVSGISKKHLFLVLAIGVLAFGTVWNVGFKDYQKERILNFIHPLADIQGSGYNAYQAMITVGSGELLGKGIGYGTQSRLNFLPEYETDFIFAAYAEEWGFIGVIMLFILYGIIIIRIFKWAMRGETNFETLYGIGLAIFFMVHLIINIGMNIGLLPVTGIPVPFMSYGGSHLVTEFLGLGILMGMSRYSRAAHREGMTNEFLGA